jgi:hypothetical protein
LLIQVPVWFLFINATERGHISAWAIIFHCRSASGKSRLDNHCRETIGSNRGDTSIR